MQRGETSEQLQYDLDKQIEAKLGKEYLEEIAGISRSIFNEIKMSLVQIGNDEGSTSQQRERAQQVLQMWRQFANDLNARTSSSNKRSPETVEAAVKGADALMSPEPTSENGADAKVMIRELQRRYGAS